MGKVHLAQAHLKSMVQLYCNCTDILCCHGVIGLGRKWDRREVYWRGDLVKPRGKNNLSKSMQLLIKSCHLPSFSLYLSPLVFASISGFFFLAYLLAVGT